MAPRTRFDKQRRVDTSPYQLVLLCENNTGYQNLIKLVSHGYTGGFYSKPRIDRELPEQPHDGPTALSACLAGAVQRRPSGNAYDNA